MAYVPGYEQDIFVSYGRVDDEPLPGVEKGWVSGLVETLNIRLRALIGRGDELSIWKDEQLSKHGDLTPALIQTVQNTALLMVIMSRGYLKSPWCQRERETFLNAVQQRRSSGSRVFLVLIDDLDLRERPPEFGDLLGYKFWEDRSTGRPKILGYPLPDPRQDDDYYSSVEDLARDLYGELERLRQLDGSAAPTPVAAPEVSPVAAEAPSASPAMATEATSPNGSDAPCIYLAEATDDVDYLRDEVKRYLDQQKFRVLPDSWYASDPAEFQAAVSKDLENSLAFVQLLGAFAGKKLPGQDQSRGMMLHQLALAASKPILQWRDASLDLNSVRDPAHRLFLDGSTVIASDIELFKGQVVELARKELEERNRPEPQFPVADEAFVFVQSDKEDASIADQLCGLLAERGLMYALPIHEGSAEEIREDREANLVDCDALVVVYGEITEGWVREQLRNWRKILFRREKPLRALAVCEGPPADKRPLGMRLPNMHILNCRDGIRQEDLLPFFDALRDK